MYFIILEAMLHRGLLSLPPPNHKCEGRGANVSTQYMSPSQNRRLEEFHPQSKGRNTEALRHYKQVPKLPPGKGTGRGGRYGIETAAFHADNAGVFCILRNKLCRSTNRGNRSLRHLQPSIRASRICGCGLHPHPDTDRFQGLPLIHRHMCSKRHRIACRSLRQSEIHGRAACKLHAMFVF